MSPFLETKTQYLRLLYSIMRKTTFKIIISALSLVLIITLGFIFAKSSIEHSQSAKTDNLKSREIYTMNSELNKLNKPKELDTAAFGAGCFWGVEETFSQIKGVKNTTVGYMGGTLNNPTYEDVCTDKTGHAETVLVEYDPAEVSYDDLLKVFWENHNPTTMNRQGPDFGTQYRSVVFYYNYDQKTAAEKSKDELQKSGKYTREIVTQIIPATTFWKAEEYHQKYLEKHGLSHCNY
jgi:peptide-methionine (S)-S-oxide reductase